MKILIENVVFRLGCYVFSFLLLVKHKEWYTLKKLDILAAQ